METVNLLIKGKVQGVFYRASARDKAAELGIIGWVKNTQDGNVEIVASGKKEALKKFIEWCHQGPSQAKVTGVTVREVDANNFLGFQILK
jgi:acylphosphatase